MRLTAKERILLYLLEVSKLDTMLEAPRELAQEGVAAGSEVDLRHLPQSLRPLMEQGLVRERRAHVRGIRQRRKVYALTEAGTMAAVRLRERAKLETIQVRDAQGVHAMSAGQVLEVCHRRMSLAELAMESARAGIVDLTVLTSAPSLSDARALDGTTPRPVIEMLSDAPRIGDFVGRERELSLITENGEGPRVILVRGIAGMGKSCLAAKACDVLRGKRNLFWHRVRPWDTRKSVLAHMSEFFSALGKPGLRSILKRGEWERASEVLRTDLPGTRAFLVFDDAHEAAADVLQLLSLLKEVVADVPDVRTLICTRRALRGFGQKDLLQVLVQQIELEGLAREEVLRFLEAHRVPAELLVLGGKMGGHPLSLRLLRSAKDVGALRQSRHGLRLLLEEEVYRDLSKAERTMMKIASLYRVPVPREALFGGPGLTHDVLLSLADRSLLRAVGLDDWEAHDSIRGFFAELLSPSERTTLGRFAAHQLQELAQTVRAEGRAEVAVNALSNALLVTTSDRERVQIWEALGDAHENTGNLPEALTAFREVVRTTKESERVARAHRKCALAYLVREEYPPAARELDAAEAALRSRRGPEWGWIEWGRGQIALNEEPWKEVEAAKRAENAVRAFRRLHDPGGQARALCLQGRVAIYGVPSDVALGQRCFEEAVVLSEQIKDTRLAADAHICLAELFALFRCDYERALQQLRLIETCQGALGDPWAGPMYLWFKGVINLELSADCEQAERDFLDMGRLCRKFYDTSGGLAAIAGRASTLYYRGRLEEAQRGFDETWMESRSRGWLNFSPSAKALWMSAVCSLRKGDLDGFRRLAAVSRARDFVVRVDERTIFDKLLNGIDRWIQGDQAGAERAFASVLESVERTLPRNEMPYYYNPWAAPFFYGCVLRATGRDVEADKYLEMAKDTLRAYSLKSRLSVLPDEERELVATLRHVHESRLPLKASPV